LATKSFLLSLNIVNRGEWLGDPANFKGSSYCYDLSLVTWS
jgi:hypothetical protein